MNSSVLMCSPDYFDVEYVINPWMKPGTVNRTVAQAQWRSLVEAYQALGIQVHIIPQQQHVPDMVFATDQGIVRNGEFIVSNFRYPERQAESHFFTDWFTEHGFGLKKLIEHVYFEGGDLMELSDHFFLGTGFRSEKNAARHLASYLECECIPLELVDEAFYHLDTCLLMLNDETAFYYPPAFSEQSQYFLKQSIPNLYEFTKKEVLGFSANSVRVGKTVICQSGNPTFTRRLQDLGYSIKELNLSEFIKAGGGIHCLTLKLN